MIHPVAGSPVPVGKACSNPARPALATSRDERANPSGGSRYPDASIAAAPASHVQAQCEARSSQQPEEGFVPVREAAGGQGGSGGNAAAGVDQKVEGQKDRPAANKDPYPPGYDLATTELSAASAVVGEEGDATRGGDVEEVVPGAASGAADDASLAACADAGADGGVELDTCSLLEKAEGALTRLYDTHDNFFGSDKDEKERRLKGQAQEVLEALAAVDDGHVRGMRERVRVSYIRGRALDVFGDFDPEAEKCLARAVKLRPSDADGWSGLGHCYWKKPDLFAARRCFLTSLEKSRSADTMRQLSMLLRQLPATADETQQQDDHLQESLRLAKEALTMDIGCGDSWYVLGNAYVASFFRTSRGIRNLDRALQAYKKAESNGGGGNPDLFFNRAHVFHYREDYPEATRDYRFARQLDPLLPVGPALQSIETGVERLARLVDRKGGLTAKRVSQLIAPLWGDSARRGLGGSYRLVGLKDLRLGKNKGVAVALKVVMSAGQTTQPPERFVVVDRGGEAAVLSLYSMKKEACEKIQSKDTLVVKDPSFRTICVVAPPPSPPPRTAGRPGRPASCLGGPIPGDGASNAGKSDAATSSAPGNDGIGECGGLGTIDGPSGVSSEACAPRDSGKATASPTVPEAGKRGEASGSAAARGEAVVAASTAGLRGHGGVGDVGDPTGSAAAADAAAASGGPSAATAAGAGAVLPTMSYPGIQADLAEVLLNGDTMRASFAPPTVRLATFDK